MKMRIGLQIIALLLCPALLATATAPPPLPHPPKQGGMYVIAHRGAHQGIPENTLAAYRKAIELGCDFVEIDVRTTKDGALVSVHNATMEAYTGGAELAVRDLTLAELVHDGDYLAGLSREGDTVVYVTRGVGTWGPPVRVAAPPEVTIITLRSVPARRSGA